MGVQQRYTPIDTRGWMEELKTCGGRNVQCNLDMVCVCANQTSRNRLMHEQIFVRLSVTRTCTAKVYRRSRNLNHRIPVPRIRTLRVAQAHPCVRECAAVTFCMIAMSAGLRNPVLRGLAPFGSISLMSLCVCGILQCKPKFEVKRRYLNEKCLGNPVQAVYRRASRDVLNVLNNQVFARSLP
jgi:hypothetical protein